MNKNKVSKGHNRFAIDESLKEQDLNVLIHDLRVHQIELELKNEELLRVQKELKEAKYKYYTLYNFAPEGYLIVSGKGRIIEANRKCFEVFGVKNLKLVGQSITDFIDGAYQDTYYLMRKRLSVDSDEQKCVIKMIRRNHITFWAELTIKYLLDENNIRLHVIIRDVTQRKENEIRIDYLNNHDQLTGLYNRRFYEEELKKINTLKNLPLSIIMTDVNGLKMFNDSFGHNFGDELLMIVADTLVESSKDEDIIARISGGDEFVILLPRTNTLECNEYINKVQKGLVDRKVKGMDITVSFGYTTKFEMDEDINKLLTKAEDSMYSQKVYESADIKRKFIDSIMNALDQKSHKSVAHSKRVSQLCEMIATRLNVDKENISKIRIAGLLHDIGKIGISEQLLNADWVYDEKDMKLMEKHSEIGCRILNSAPEFMDVAQYVLEHHEKWDGSGYPKGLRGLSISLPARIVAVANAYDSMTNEKGYGTLLSNEEAICEIEKYSGKQFDPDVVEKLIDIVK